MAPLLESALAYAARGWPVLPCRPDKSPLTHHGVHDAATDPQTLTTWWSRWPDAAIGVACGPARLFVVDCDVRPGVDGVASFERLGIPHDGALHSQTPRGGLHVVFRNHGLPLANSVGRLALGIDTRGVGGYVIVPPSVISHGTYIALDDWSREPAELPDELRAMLQERPHIAPPAPVTVSGMSAYGAAALADEVVRVARAQVGERNNMLYVAAASLGELVAGGEIDEGAVRAALLPAALSAGLGEREARSTIESGLRGGASTTRQHPNGVAITPRGATREKHDPPPPMLPLPMAAYVDHTLGELACPWLDDYIMFSRTWSPRAFSAYHEAIGVWLLSVVAARRVTYAFGGPRFTPLYIALAARSGITAKTTTTRIAYQLLEAAGLGYLLTALDSTPQRFLSDLTTRLPDNLDELPTEHQALLKTRLRFAGQRGWLYDEFGKKISAMMRENGIMSDFRRLLLKFDDCDSTYDYGTQTRTDHVDRPYLALLANLTPSDLFRLAGRNAELWSDGFLARFALLTPPPQFEHVRARFPRGETVFPPALIEPLKDWGRRLGLPDLDTIPIVAPGGQQTGVRYQIRDFPQHTLIVGDEVREAAYQYHDALLDLTQLTTCTDLDASYIRFTEKALRIAALFASFSGSNIIEIGHWARAQAIVEQWRAGLHNLYAQVNGHHERGDSSDLDGKILGAIDALAIRGVLCPTAREIGQYIAGYGATDLEPHLVALVESGRLTLEKRPRSAGYRKKT